MGGGLQRVHGGVNTLLGDFTAQHRGGVQMGERGDRCRVGQVVHGHIHRLHGGNRPVIGGGNALLQSAHLPRQRGLIAHSGGHASQQRGNLAARLDKTENIGR